MNKAMPSWHEEYAGGSEEAERQLIEGYVRDIRAIQERTAAKAGKSPDRTLHAKIIVGVRNARLVVDRDLPPDLAAGYFQPGAELATAIRLSNASPFHRGDTAADMRGAALRINTGDGGFHDLLMTSYPVSHARDAWQFIEVAKIATGPKPLVLPRFILKFGLSETLRILRNIKTGSQPIESLRTQQFWSRAPLLWGSAGPVRYALRPVAQPAGKQPDETDRNYLATEFANGAAAGDVLYKLSLQRYVDSETTPIENGAAEWRESDAPFVDVATLIIPAQDLGSTEAVRAKQAIDGLAFNPWNCPPQFRPLGGLNRARNRVYFASAAGWLGSPDSGARVNRTGSVRRANEHAEGSPFQNNR